MSLEVGCEGRRWTWGKGKGDTRKLDMTTEAKVEG